jgi:inhibitor of growth protein 3
LPAEIAHLYEEAQAKQDMINDCNAIINSRDSTIQKFIKQNGSLVVNPKEDEYSNTVKKNFIKMQELQDEKLALLQKSCVLVCICDIEIKGPC